MSIESFVSKKNNQEEIAERISFENETSFEYIFEVLQNTREKLNIIKEIPGFEKDVTDLQLQIKNLEERLSTIRN